MEIEPNEQEVDAIVAQIFHIEGRQAEDARTNQPLQYFGRLRSPDSEAAYEWIDGRLKPLGLMPLFRLVDGRQQIWIVPALPEPKRANPWINLIFFIATVLSVWVTGGTFNLAEPLPADLGQAVVFLLSRGWPYAISIILILGAHEMGHYFAARRHGVYTTLPYFIPLPLTPFGTMGAFIQMRAIPKNRNQLLDIGLAGPLSGLVFALPILLIGLALSTLTNLPAVPGDAQILMEGNSLTYLLAKLAIFGRLLPDPSASGGISTIQYWFSYFLTGRPLPYGAVDVSLHMVAWAGWAGLLVTAINLIPAGQFDGGHLIYVLLGKVRARRLLPFLLVLLIGMGFLYAGWWLWAALILLLGRTHAEPLDQITPLSPGRRALALVTLVIFLLVFVPVPVVILP